jgi:hypothetical protein
MPWLLGAAVGLKLVVGGWAVRRLRRRGLVADRALLVLAGIWVFVAGALIGLLAWVVPGDLVPAGTLAMGVILMMPLARLSVMPLALDWNRHR